MLTWLLILLVDDHGVLQAIILGRLWLNHHILLILAGNSRVLHVSSGRVDDAGLGNSAVIPKQLLLLMSTFESVCGLNI